MMIGNCHPLETNFYSLSHQIFGLQLPIRAIGMHVKIVMFRTTISLNAAKDLPQERSILC